MVTARTPLLHVCRTAPRGWALNDTLPTPHRRATGVASNKPFGRWGEVCSVTPSWPLPCGVDTRYR